MRAASPLDHGIAQHVQTQCRICNGGDGTGMDRSRACEAMLSPGEQLLGTMKIADVVSTSTL